MLVFLIFSGRLAAQYDFVPVLAGMEGQELKDALVQQYKPSVVLDFASAKDILYSEIYEINDSVSCVYTGHRLYLDPDADPSQYLYLNGIGNGINAEHTYPKSKGASEGNAESDLYNLFPTRLAVNSDRGNLPFGEIPDSQTDYWYFLDNKTTGIPVENIDAYSEISSNRFEPREDHKGNVARAIFYFVTMYAEEVNAADPGFFEGMRETLCDWHYMDPVDSLEWIRNERIAGYQSDKSNPFILDCSLAGRTYCDFIDAGCIAVNIDNTANFDGPQNDVQVYPNPFTNKLNFRFPNDPGYQNIMLTDIYGKIIVGWNKNIKTQHSMEVSEFSFDASSLENGIYVLLLQKFGPDGQAINNRIFVIKN
jgi:hypothetical protein